MIVIRCMSNVCRKSWTGSTAISSASRPTSITAFARVTTTIRTSLTLKHFASMFMRLYGIIFCGCSTAVTIPTLNGILCYKSLTNTVMKCHSSTESSTEATACTQPASRMTLRRWTNKTSDLISSSYKI